MPDIFGKIINETVTPALKNFQDSLTLNTDTLEDRNSDLGNENQEQQLRDYEYAMLTDLKREFEEFFTNIELNTATGFAVSAFSDLQKIFYKRKYFTIRTEVINSLQTKLEELEKVKGWKTMPLINLRTPGIDLDDAEIDGWIKRIQNTKDELQNINSQFEE